MLQQLAGHPSTHGTDQDLLTDQVPILVVEAPRQLGQGASSHADMVGCVNWLPCFPGHPDGQHFTGAGALAVLGHGDHRSEPEPAPIGARGVFLAGAHVHQRRVDIHGQGIGTSRPDGGAALACGGPKPGADLALHGGEGIVERPGMPAEPGEEAAERALGGHRSEDPWGDA